MRCNFEMAVEDVVAFEGGRTVFAGEISHGPKFIPACDCELIVAGVPVAKFKIEGEMMPLRRTQENENLRAVSTAEKVDVALVRRSKGTMQIAVRLRRRGMGRRRGILQWRCLHCRRPAPAFRRVIIVINSRCSRR
jgi:hypothetical protein